MALSIDRRTAFARAFALYPKILSEFAEKRTVMQSTLSGGEVPVPENKIDDVCEVMFAQFITRVIQTRAAGTTPELERFASDTVDRYHEFCLLRLGLNALAAGAKSRAALQAYEENMVATMFEALAEEFRVMAMAASQRPVAEGDLAVMDEWSEADFWEDAFMSFHLNARPHGPRWSVVADEMYATRKAEFWKALDSE